MAEERRPGERRGGGLTGYAARALLLALALTAAPAQADDALAKPDDALAKVDDALTRADDPLARALAVPIADMHMHLTTARPSFYRDQMARNRVHWGGAVGGLLDDQTEWMAGQLGPAYVHALGQFEFTRVFFQRGPAGLADPELGDFVRLFARAERLLAAGKAHGFGELHLDNARSAGPGNERFARRVPVDNPVMRRVYAIADRHAAFVQIHMEGTPEGLADLARPARDHPRTTTILSHCLPWSGPATLRALFDALPNLMCELSATGPVHRIARVYDAERVRPEFLALIEDHPDRFMLGTDTCCGLESLYDEMIREARVYLLARLTPKTREKVAYRNALRLLRLPAP